jgi:hypothetical protein
MDTLTLSRDTTDDLRLCFVRFILRSRCVEIVVTLDRLT